MRKQVRVVGAAVGSVALASGLVMSTLGGTAVAGHENRIASATLAGDKEVRKNGKLGGGDRDGRGTVSVFGVDKSPNTLCYVLRVSKIGLEGLAGHIHKGGKRVNGPVVVSLAAPGDGDASDCFKRGDTRGPMNAQVFLVKGVGAQQILKRPGDFYVNVHNSEFPDGAIRGQLRAEN